MDLRSKLCIPFSQLYLNTIYVILRNHFMRFLIVELFFHLNEASQKFFFDNFYKTRWKSSIRKDGLASSNTNIIESVF